MRTKDEPRCWVSHHRGKLSVAAATVGAVAIGFIAGGGSIGSADSEEQATARTEAAAPTLFVEAQSLAAIDDAFDVALEPVTPSKEYHATVWTAREKLITECMTSAGFSWVPRPNEVADPASAKEWPGWESWFAGEVAKNATFEQAAFGGTDVSGNVGGCQRAAYLEVHGPGEEAYSQAANLTNAANADQVALIESKVPITATSAETAAQQWAQRNAAAISAVSADLDAELANAQTIIND